VVSDAGPTITRLASDPAGAARRLRVRAGGALAGAVALMIGVLFVAGHSGGTLSDPVGARPWELAQVVIALVILGVGVGQSVRERKLSRVLLIAIASGTAFWQETYGDWGTYLLYSPQFSAYSWGDTMWSSPVRCWWFIPGYVFFYTTFFLALEKAFHGVKLRWPESNPYVVTTAVSFPMFFIFDLTLEGAAHGFGWWQYQYAFGPTVAVGQGHFPLLWPILEQVPFMVLAVFALTWRNAHGEDAFEFIAREVARRKPGQISILVSWIVTLNASFLLTTILPLMALRWLAGPASAAVP
jgi:Spirocyclase AveC-like